MTDLPTCGKGLAESSPLPAKIGELIDAVGSILETHLSSLDLTDEDSRKEYELYQRLVAGHREAAGQLAAIAGQMSGARDLPMGRHDEATMTSAAVLGSFQRFVELERDLVTMLEVRLEEDELMLSAMREGGT